MSEKKQLLKSVFGHDRFRSFQEEAVDAILAKKDLLMILPTGGGKSLCYQLPSLLMEGVTVVVSPLLALMHDQVLALKSNGIAAQMITSMQTSDEIAHIQHALRLNKLKLLYVAPERFNQEYFLALLHEIKINFFVIDEAHCVSAWGHEFREDYRKLHLLKEAFPEVSIAAFTATATPKVQADITHALRLEKPQVLRGKVFRDNLHISVEPRIKDGRVQLLEFLKNFPNESGIIYAFSRKQTEVLAKFLQTQGIKAKPFHAGLSTSEKNQTFKAFTHDEVQVVVATIAFGMGIDKSNIRFVVHMSLPKTIENYYQEIGRAGRDGLASEVLLLYSGADRIMQAEFIAQLEASEYKNHAFDKLEQMSGFTMMEGCRHVYIANYFEDDIAVCQTLCDNCMAPQSEKSDITQEAQMLLSSVYRTGGRFGQAYVIDVLRGTNSEKIQANGHDTLALFGIGEAHTKAYWEGIVQRLMELGALKRGAFRALELDKVGLEILKNKRTVSIDTLRLEAKIKKTRPIHHESFNAETSMQEQSHTFETLRALRAQIAKQEGKPAYIVFSDKTLKEMAHILPQDKRAMLSLHGVGQMKFERYGEAFLECCRSLR